MLRRAGDAGALVRRHRPCGRIEARARLDLHERKMFAAPGDHVDLAGARAEPALDYPVALGAKQERRQNFRP